MNEPTLAGRPSARIGLLAAALALLVSLALASPAVALEQKLTASDGVGGDQFGDSVAVDGDTLVAGAPGDDADKGAVYVFQRSGDSWAFVAKLTASDGLAGDELGISVAIDGDTIVAGAFADDFPGPVDDQGSVYTFARTGAVLRNETAKLTASDGVAFDRLGFSVAIDGDTIVAGAFGDDSTEGAAYTFARTGPDRMQTAKLTASDPVAFDSLGQSVAIDGDTIVAGAAGDDFPGPVSEQGSAYTFARTGLDRMQTAKLTASDGAASDGLGNSVAIDGDTIVAAAAGDDSGKGAAYTFARSGGDRNQTAKLTASDGLAGDNLGNSVAIKGPTIVAGARFDDASKGSAYTFARSGAAVRPETAKLTAPDGAAADQFGFSVAIDGEQIAVGARFDDSAKGSVWVFFPPGPSSPPPGSAAPAGPASPAAAASACKKGFRLKKVKTRSGKKKKKCVRKKRKRK